MTVKNRDYAAGVIMRLAQQELDDCECIFYRTPGDWEAKARCIAVYVGTEDTPEYFAVEATDDELRTKPLSTLAPRVVNVCRHIRKIRNGTADNQVPPPKRKKIKG